MWSIGTFKGKRNGKRNKGSEREKRDRGRVGKKYGKWVRN